MLSKSKMHSYAWDPHENTSFINTLHHVLPVCLVALAAGNGLAIHSPAAVQPQHSGLGGVHALKHCSSGGGSWLKARRPQGGS